MVRNGQGIHIGADHDGRAIPIVQYANDAVSADAILDLTYIFHCLGDHSVLTNAGGNVEVEIFKFRGHQSGRFGFLERKFRIGVKLFVDFDQFCISLWQVGFC